MTASLLLIHDYDASYRELHIALVQAGYRVDQASVGMDGIRTMLTGQPDLVLVGIDNQQQHWQFCCQLLSYLDKPLLLLLSTGSHLDRVRGLHLGADDCMVEPLLLAEVLARVDALLRRGEARVSSSRQRYFVDEELVVDLVCREAWLCGRPVELTPTEFRLLCCLTQHVGEVLPHERLASFVWGSESADARDAIKQYVHRLRQKLELNPRHPTRILTRRGEGYMFRGLADRQAGA